MSNGCGCEHGLLRWVRPPFAAFFRAACELHDNDYDIGGTPADRKVADALLLQRCVRLIADAERPPLTMIAQCASAALMWAAVRCFGMFYFNNAK